MGCGVTVRSPLHHAPLYGGIPVRICRYGGPLYGGPCMEPPPMVPYCTVGWSLYVVPFPLYGGGHCAESLVCWLTVWWGCMDPPIWCPTMMPHCTVRGIPTKRPPCIVGLIVWNPLYGGCHCIEPLGVGGFIYVAPLWTEWQSENIIFPILRIVALKTKMFSLCSFRVWCFERHSLKQTVIEWQKFEGTSALLVS